MKRNFTRKGRYIRFGLGFILIFLSLFHDFKDPLLDYILIGLGLFIVLTAIIWYCPLYSLLDLNTYKDKNDFKMY